MKTLLFDAIDVIDGARITRDGFLVAEARVARTGIQHYLASELGIADAAPDSQIRVYRPPDEVFSKDAMMSYAHRPVTVDHPQQMIDSENWKEHAAGQTGEDVLRDGEFVRVPLVLMDKAAIDEWANGKRELSMGYTMTLDMKPGTTPSGEQYDAVQRQLRMNHLALVSRARGGSQLRLGDRKPEDSSMSDVKLTTITVDGLSVETTDAGAQAISKLQAELASAKDDLTDATAKHEEAIAAKDREIAQKDAQIDDLNGKILSDADLDQRVNERADLIATAKRIADKDYSGMSDADIRKTAVTAKIGAEAIDGKSDDYVQARFDILADEASEDGVRRVLKTGAQPNATAADAAHAEMCNDLGNAWQRKQQGGTH